MKNTNISFLPIKSWAIDDRPREKMQNNGAETLSNAELLAILINNGSKKRSALELAKDLLRLGENNLNELAKLSLKEIQQVKGIGVAKAIAIAAALELGRRRNAMPVLEKTRITCSRDIALYLQTKIKDFSYEVFAVVFLNKSNKIIHFEIVSRGGITGTVADPRIILKKALEENATSIVLCHNHPSGNLQPSKADIDITNKIKGAVHLLDINLIDHIIVSEEGWYSFADEGVI